ncbi:MAG TPA: MarR family winged helix-turn-helix transcriptional regulator [Candidatus Limnocylindrales bacterium]|jgi:DNA-binding MarR family transcriptional regulator|nr:MarR family winged helix-turn-helix transcriptional regulator [Candidatus Limnocylindrales bacterium]
MTVARAPARDSASDRRIAAGDARLDAWRAFLQAHVRLFRRLDEDLRAEHGLSLAEYDALLQIAQAPERHLRMSQLASRVLLSKSGVTRLVDRLVADGLVERTQCSSDARGAEAALTADGLARLRAAAPTHLRGIDAYFISAVEPADLAVLERSMNAISRHTGDAGSAPDSDAACDPSDGVPGG